MQKEEKSKMSMLERAEGCWERLDIKSIKIKPYQKVSREVLIDKPEPR